jgi:integrase-like protein
MWDVKSALEKLKQLTTSNLEETSQKTAFLLSLCTCWRPASDLARIPKEAIRFMECGGVEVQAVDVKEGGSKMVRLKPFPDKSICPVATLRLYIDMTTPIRKEISERLFIKMNGEDATGDTIRRWIKKLFPKLNIDIAKFKPHSLRATASSTAMLKEIAINEVIRLGNWSAASTFKRYYLKPWVEQQDPPTNGIQGLLQSPNEVLPKGIVFVPFECVPRWSLHR